MHLIKVTGSEYFSHQSMGFHDLKALSKSYQHFLASRETSEQKSYQAFGTAAHLAVLEPELFKTEVAVAPAVDRRTKAGRDEYEAFMAHAHDKLIVTQDEYDSLLRMQDSARSHGNVAKLLENALIEHAFFVDVEYIVDGNAVTLPLKGRIDACKPEARVFIEYKTTQDASFESFAWDIRRYSYDLQLAHYARFASDSDDGIELYIIAQEKQEPFGVTVTQVVLNSDLIKRHNAFLETCAKNLVTKSGYQEIINVYEPRG